MPRHTHTCMCFLYCGCVCVRLSVCAGVLCDFVCSSTNLCVPPLWRKKNELYSMETTVSYLEAYNSFFFFRQMKSHITHFFSTRRIRGAEIQCTRVGVTVWRWEVCGKWVGGCTRLAVKLLFRFWHWYVCARRESTDRVSVCRVFSLPSDHAI